jgi:hypothetical protein
MLEHTPIIVMKATSALGKLASDEFRTLSQAVALLIKSKYRMRSTLPSLNVSADDKKGPAPDQGERAMTELISIVEAATLLQPHVPDINALNLLSDWRRVRSSYRSRLKNPPRSVRHGGVVKYPRSEIERAIREILEFRSRPLLLN